MAHAEVPVLHSRRGLDGLLQRQPVQVQEFLQLLQLGGSAQLSRPARGGRAGSGNRALPFTFQEGFARLLQARLVGGDIRAGGLVQMHGPHAEVRRETLGARARGPRELPPHRPLRREPSATTLPPVQDGVSWVVLPKRTTGLWSSIFLPAILYIIAIGSF